MVEGRVKGETVARMWKTIRLRGHSQRVEEFVSRPLVEALESGQVLANNWYPIEHYLALYGGLMHVAGYKEVVATAADSVTRALRRGSWKVFVPLMAELAPETFCQMTAKRFELVWKQTFDRGEARISTTGSGSIEGLVTNAPWSSEEAWRAGVSGGLIAIPQYANFEASCEVDEPKRGTVRFRLGWHKK